MDGATFSEQEFFRQRSLQERRWGVALFCGLLVHVAVFTGAYYLPEYLDRQPLLDEVMTIDLVSLPEPADLPKPTLPVREQNPEPVRKAALPEPVRKAALPEPVRKAALPEPAEPPLEPEADIPVEVAPELTPIPDVAEIKPISLRPRIRKIKKAKDTRLVEEKAREQRAREIKRQEKARKLRALQRKRQEKKRKRSLARARALEKQAAEDARLASAEVAALIREKAAIRSSVQNRSTGASSGSKQVNSAIEKQYISDLAGRVERLWILPEIKKWPSTLETIVEFTVLRDGRLVNVTVAKSSGDSFFDRFARETVKKAAPMPPFPPALKKNRMDLGFRLRPAGVQH